MNIESSQSGPERSKRSFDQQQLALIDANRALVRSAREDLAAVGRQRLSRSLGQGPESARRDELQLSAASVAASEQSTAEREAHVRELAEAHRMERLHTPERIERAAQRLLEG